MMVESVRCSRCGSDFARRQVDGGFDGICPRCLAGFMAADSVTGAAPPRMETMAPTLRLGDQLEGFKIIEVLGQGGMGVVYKALQASLNRTVALKILSPHLAGSVEFVKRFEREARVLATLSHPNVVQVFDFGKGSHPGSGEFLYLAMEFVDGTTLEELFRKAPIDPPRLLGIIRDVTRGLEKIHAMGLVHRDLKPSNILIAKDGTAKISDFGLAIETADLNRLTQSGMLVGTPHYISPEHAQGRKVDGRADLYALGVILFEGTARKLPFDAPSAAAILLKHVNEPPPPLYKHAPHASRALQEIVRKLMAKNPASRHENATALGRDLDRAMGAAPAPLPRAEGVLSTPPPAVAAGTLSWKLIGAGTAALVLSAVILASVLGGSKPAPMNRAEDTEARAPAVPRPPTRTEAPAAKAAPAAEEPFLPVPPPAAPPKAPAESRPAAVESAPQTAAPQTAPTDPLEEVWRQAEALFEEARKIYEDGRSRSSSEILHQAGFKTEEALSKYRALQEVGSPELRNRAGERIRAVQQLIKLVNESRLAVANAGAPAPPPPAVPPTPPPPVEPPPPTAPTVRVPVPPEAALKKVEMEIRDLFRAEYARKAPAEMAAFARKLLEQGASMKDDPITSYVLLREARELAIQAGNPLQALEAVTAMGKMFEMDVLAAKQATLGRAPGDVRGTEAAALAEACEALTREAVEADAYETASACVTKGETFARAAQDAAAAARMAELKKEVAFLKEEYRKAKASLETPGAGDPEAGGRFLCLCKGNWERGLPLLASARSPIGELASRDQASPREVEKKIEVADGWWDLAEKENNPIRKARIQERARFWYEAVMAEAAGLLRAKAEKRLALLEAPARGPVNLIALIRPERDAVTGRWRTEQGRLLNEPEWFGRIQIPYVPPAEYDWRLVIERKSGTGDLYLGLVRGTAAVGIAIDAGNSTYTGIGDMTPRGEGLGRFPGGVLPANRQVTLLCEVRKQGFTLTADRKKLAHYAWKGNEARELLPEKWDVPNPAVLFLGAHGSVFQVHSMTLVPVSGQGRVHRTPESSKPATAAPSGQKVGSEVRGAINLLALINPQKDGVVGNWIIDGPALVTPAVEWACLQIPYEPPDEYDLRIVAEKKSGSDAFIVGLVAGDRQFRAMLDGRGGGMAGFDVIDGTKLAFENETTRRISIFTDDKPKEILCSVRKGGTVVSADGKTVIEWKGGYGRLSNHTKYSVPDRRALYLAAYATGYRITQVTLVSLSGPGKKLR